MAESTRVELTDEQLNKIKEAWTARSAENTPKFIKLLEDYAEYAANKMKVPYNDDFGFLGNRSILSSDKFHNSNEAFLDIQEYITYGDLFFYNMLGGNVLPDERPRCASPRKERERDHSVPLLLIPDGYPTRDEVNAELKRYVAKNILNSVNNQVLLDNSVNYISNEAVEIFLTQTCGDSMKSLKDFCNLLTSFTDYISFYRFLYDAYGITINIPGSEYEAPEIPDVANDYFNGDETTESKKLWLPYSLSEDRNLYGYYYFIRKTIVSSNDFVFNKDSDRAITIESSPLNSWNFITPYSIYYRERNDAFKYYMNKPHFMTDKFESLDKAIEALCNVENVIVGGTPELYNAIPKARAKTMPAIAAIDEVLDKTKEQLA